MAWYAELKRRNWYCICQVNMIAWYSEYLYDEWYASLTDEQKATLEEIHRKEREQREKELRTSMMKLAALTDMMAGIASRGKSKYGDLYDENGFIKH